MRVPGGLDHIAINLMYNYVVGKFVLLVRMISAYMDKLCWKMPNTGNHKGTVILIEMILPRRVTYLTGRCGSPNPS